MKTIPLLVSAIAIIILTRATPVIIQEQKHKKFYHVTMRPVVAKQIIVHLKVAPRHKTDMYVYLDNQSTGVFSTAEILDTPRGPRAAVWIDVSEGQFIQANLHLQGIGLFSSRVYTVTAADMESTGPIIFTIDTGSY